MADSRTTSKFKSYIAPILSAVLSIIYFLLSTVEITAADFELVAQVSLKIALILVFGMSISSLVGEIGYDKGKKDPDYVDTRASAVNYSTQILPDKAAAEIYVSEEIDKKIVMNRTSLLNSNGVMYENIFNEDGSRIQFTKQELRKKYRRKQIKAIKRSYKIIKKPFSLLAYSEADLVGLETAPNEITRRSKKFTTGLISRVFTAVVSGSILFTWVGWSPEQIIYTLMQIGLWLGSGALDAYKNFNYITVNVRDYDKSRIGYMKAFIALSEYHKDEYRIKSGQIKPTEHTETSKPEIEQILSNNEN